MGCRSRRDGDSAINNDAFGPSVACDGPNPPGLATRMWAVRLFLGILGMLIAVVVIVVGWLLIYRAFTNEQDPNESRRPDEGDEYGWITTLGIIGAIIMFICFMLILLRSCVQGVVGL